MKRVVFIISDGTGLTGESLCSSLLSQFGQVEFEKYTFPYVDTEEKAETVLAKVVESNRLTGLKPFILMTIVDPKISMHFKSAPACVLDIFGTFLIPLEQELHLKSLSTVGKAHGLADMKVYNQRIEAVNYALSHDDGINTVGYEDADIILIGVSRCGKTPSCLYMALRFGILAGNYPFTEEDFTCFNLPNFLRPLKSKLFGLSIDPSRLQQIRSERRPNSQYASLEQCKFEIKQVEAMYEREQIPCLNSTRYSIEEIATKIMAITGLERRVF